ncbi:MAG: hypothetical protein EA401_02980 [Planctomycetota bacterium]|nr:MAG: hypothetical protein EA401_02980 [Planctomycetota bacterium]
MKQSLDTPRLWFDANHHQALQKLRDQQQPHLCAVLDWARQEAQRSGDELYPPHAHPSGLPHVRDSHTYFSAQAILALLSPDADEQGQSAQRAIACYRFLTSEGYPSDLGCGAWALSGSILLDACWPHLPADEQTWLVDTLYAIHRHLRTRVTKGNPHTVNNNWWAITHGGCLLAGHAVHGRVGSDGVERDCAENIHWARQRLHAFCHHFGDAGLYHEGLGYQNYTMSMLFPALYADQCCGGPRVSDIFPNLSQSAQSIYATVVPHPPTPDTTQDDGAKGLGMCLSWNDAGPGHSGGSHEILALALAAPEQQGALRDVYDRLHGVDGDRSFAPGYSGMYFAATLYPYAQERVAAQGRLSTFIADNRQGMVIMRSGYQGPDDCTFGAYARATHVGGHSADDAGSIRLVALGHDWIVGGGQARGHASYQSVVIDDTGERPKNKPCGAIMWREATDHGGIVGMDLRKVHGAYSERYVAIDYSGACGVPVAMALLDQIDDHRDDRDWLWNCSCAPDLEILIDEDERGFRLVAADGKQLQARFVADVPQSVYIEDMPASKRTFAGGDQVQYRPRRYIQARFAAKTPLGILTAITVSHGSGPVHTLAGAGCAIRIGDHVWQRPFGAAIPADFQPGIGGGLCPYPDGHRPSD